MRKQIQRIHLFSTPSFATGMGRLVDSTGTLNVYNQSTSSKEADNHALYSDWLAVGDYLKFGMSEIDKELWR